MTKARAEQVKQRFIEELESDRFWNAIEGFPEKSEFLLDVEYAQAILAQAVQDLQDSKRHCNNHLRLKRPYRADSKLRKLAEKLVKATAELSDALERDLKEPYHIKYYREIYLAGLEESAQAQIS